MNGQFSDQLWVHFGKGRIKWKERCRACQSHVCPEDIVLPIEALDCWKVEIWYSVWAHPHHIDRVFLAWVMEDPSLAGKFSIENLPVIASDALQEPYPDEPRSRVAFIYVWQYADLYRRKEETHMRLVAGGAGPGRVHFRRGCWGYDEIYRPWPTWPFASKDQ